MTNEKDINYTECPITRLSEIVEDIQSKSEIFLFAESKAMETYKNPDKVRNLLWEEAFSAIFDFNILSNEAQECLEELLANLKCCAASNTLDFECDQIPTLEQ